MQIFKKLIYASSVLLFSASAAIADNPLPKSDEKIAKYGEVEGWSVYTNYTRRNCYIVRFDGPNAIQMGVTADRNVGYLGVFTKHKIALSDGSQTQVFVSIGGNLYEGVATGLKGHTQRGYWGGYILTDDPQLKSDLAKKYEMTVFPDTSAAFVVDLTGTYKAMEMGRKCNQEQAGS